MLRSYLKGAFHKNGKDKPSVLLHRQTYSEVELALCCHICKDNLVC